MGTRLIRQALHAGLFGLAVFALWGPDSAGKQLEEGSHSGPGLLSESDSTSVLEEAFVRQKARQGLDHLYNLRSEKAERRFRALADRYSTHPIGPFLAGLRQWWMIRLDISDRSRDETFRRNMNEALSRSEQLLGQSGPAPSFDGLFFKAAAHGMIARLAAHRGDWWTAIRHGQQAIGSARTVAEEAGSGRTDYLFGKGLYDYYAAILEEEYPATEAITWMLPDGDRKRGLRVLKRVAREGYYLRTEARWYLAKIYFFYEERYAQSRRHLEQLRKQYPANSYFHVFAGRIEARSERWDRVRTVFTEVLRRRKAGDRGYDAGAERAARYYLARAHLESGRPKRALTHLRHLQDLGGTEGPSGQYVARGHLLAGMAHDALGNRRKAVQQYRRVLEMNGPDDTERQVRQYLQDPYTP